MITFPTLSRAPATLSVDLEPFQRSSGGAQVRSEALTGALWRISLGYELLEDEDARLLEAFLAQVGASTFLLPGSIYSTQATGSTATGSALATNSVTATLPESLEPGSFITVNGELKILTKSPTGGNLTFAPAMSKVGIGAVTVGAGPTTLQCEMAEGGASSVAYGAGDIFSITLDVLEVVPIQ